ncbi:MAG: HAMP domain-containing sensor histidine kinase [Bacteroidetes bacterium]|nr:HAMP domain-containing sensor histidine kinase [Bacteroidota bacterium]MDA1333752.1 HAMP domain-containing sensor histidine kinase [Bacteroidota bacterium]
MFNRLVERIFPARASTQTWMILTLLLVVGIAVAAVGLYITFVLRSEVKVAYQQTMSQQTAQVASIIESETDPVRRLERMETLSRFGDIRITVIDGAQILDVDTGAVVQDPSIRSVPELQFGENEDFRYTQRREDGKLIYFSALRQLDSGLIIRVAQPRPMLFVLIDRLQYTLIVAMIMALLLAVFGSWIAAQRVTQPLQAIRNSAKAIAEGKLDEEIFVDSRAAEFQDLAKSLNLMSDTFKEKIDELQKMAHLQNEFIGNVSHEVRNPIFAVGGYLEALASASLSEDKRKFYAEKGLTNLERLNNLFSDLIEIARLEYREDLIKPKVFELSELLDDVYDVVHAKAEEKGLDLIVEHPQILVRADRSRIRQVLINLTDNAIAYSDEGTVRCRYRRHLDKVRIEVVDSGRGIPEEHLERIFERFHRVDPDRSRKSGGTGLGLSIVKQILAAHGENIHVESTVGRGTRFWFELAWEPGEAEAESA